MSTPQVDPLAAQLAGPGGGPGAGGPGVGLSVIPQWVQLPDGQWISEKDPGYPFLAAPFQALGIIRLAPLFYGALGCLGLFFGARRWLGRYGGAVAVGLFCSCGAALALAASWFSAWGLYAAYTWTANAFDSTLQFARFYVPAIGAISLLGSWLVTRLPRRTSLATAVSAAVVAAMFGLGAWSFAVMREFSLGGIHHGPPGVVGPLVPGRPPGALPRTDKAAGGP